MANFHVSRLFFILETGIHVSIVIDASAQIVQFFLVNFLVCEYYCRNERSIYIWHSLNFPSSRNVSTYLRGNLSIVYLMLVKLFCHLLHNFYFKIHRPTCVHFCPYDHQPTSPQQAWWRGFRIFILDMQSISQGCSSLIRRGFLDVPCERLLSWQPV